MEDNQILKDVVFANTLANYNLALCSQLKKILKNFKTGGETSGEFGAVSVDTSCRSALFARQAPVLANYAVSEKSSTDEGVLTVIFDSYTHVYPEGTTNEDVEKGTTEGSAMPGVLLYDEETGLLYNKWADSDKFHEGDCRWIPGSFYRTETLDLFYADLLTVNPVATLLAQMVESLAVQVKELNNKVSSLPSISTDNLVTTNTDQTISGEKVFSGKRTCFTSGVLSGQDGENFLNHAIRLGLNGTDKCDFLEYGAIWNFIKCINGVETIVATLNESGLTVPAIKKSGGTSAQYLMADGSTKTLNAVSTTANGLMTPQMFSILQGLYEEKVLAAITIQSLANDATVTVGNTTSATVTTATALYQALFAKQNASAIKRFGPVIFDVYVGSFCCPSIVKSFYQYGTTIYILIDVISRASASSSPTQWSMLILSLNSTGAFKVAKVLSSSSVTLSLSEDQAPEIMPVVDANDTEANEMQNSETEEENMPETELPEINQTQKIKKPFDDDSANV